MGASAGLNLQWDRYRYVSDRTCWGPCAAPLTVQFELEGDGSLPHVDQVEIVDRRGCDAAPINLIGAQGLIDALVYIWPDQPDRVERIRAAVEIAREDRIEVEKADAAAWTGRILREPVPDCATVLFHSIVEQYLGEEELTLFQRHIREAGGRASPAAPLAWLRMEPAGELAEVRLTIWPGGEERILARAGYHGTPVKLLG